MSEGNQVVERVALALWSKPLGFTDEITGPSHPRLIEMARAAIEAMREPSEAMKNAGCDVGPDTNAGEFAWDDAVRVYGAMIDAALPVQDHSGD